MLGYVFWHCPRPGTAPEAYREALLDFHRALNAHPPQGYLGSASFAVSGYPWLTADGYEDWYFIEDFTALGVLNQAAVEGARHEPHDRAAGLARYGTGGLYRLNHPSAPAADVSILLSGARWRWWRQKPAGRRYWDFDHELRSLPVLDRAVVWQRQLTLGPAPEYCIHSVDRPEPHPDGAGDIVSELTRVV